MEQDNCNELLENIKESLHFCISNKTKYNFNGKGVFYPTKCENIKNFEGSLGATKTIIQYKQPFLYLEKPYIINYNVLNRCISIEQ